MKLSNTYYHYRAPFPILFGTIDITSQISLMKLKNGNYLAVDAIPLNETDRKEFDDITQDGRLIEGLLCVHPFHTSYIRDFANRYPDVPKFTMINANIDTDVEAELLG